MKTFTRVVLLWLAVLSLPAVAADGDAHGPRDTDNDHAHGSQSDPSDDHQAHQADASIAAEAENDGDQHGAGALELSEQQQRTLGLRVIELRAQPSLTRSLTVPAEITNNQYRTWTVPVRVDSQVLERAVTLGQHLKGGDPIATLFSPAMADLQSELRVAADEWRRVRGLGRRTVGNQRYLEVQSRYNSLRARARGFGLSDEDLQSLEKGESEEGVYTLRAPDQGLVLTDAFQQGQWLTAGQPLVTLVDEAQLWAEAALPPEPGLRVPIGTPATVRVDNTRLEGEVIQAGHRLDPVTRTLQVRVRVPNEQHLLHPGMFADVSLALPVDDDALSVPEAALTRAADGDWQLFVEQAPGRYRPVPVSTHGQLDGARLVEGVPAGTRVVVDGAFFLASEMAKSGFDVHRH